MVNKFIESLKGKMGEEAFAKIQAARIGIAGCGGLGSNCASNLVRSGFRFFKIVDFDKVDYSNMDRQFYFTGQTGMDKVSALKDNLKAINPGIEIELIKLKLDKANVSRVFKGCDIIVEALDRAEDKSMMVAAFKDSDKLLVAASGLAGYGGGDDIKTHRLQKNLVVVGDLKSGIDKAPPLSPRVNIAAAKQADVVLERVLTEGALKAGEQGA